MNDLDKEKLLILGSDLLLRKALRGLFDEIIDEIKPVVSSGENNWMLGEKYRAYEQSKLIVDKAFTKIDSYQRLERGGERKNPAR